MREKLADIQHRVWAKWMRYLFAQCHTDVNHPGCLIIPASKVDRWQHQIATPYSELTEREKDSDRHQADLVLQAIEEQES